MVETNKATTEFNAEGPNPKPGYYATRYKTDTAFAERERERARGKYKSLPNEKKAEIIAQKTAKYFSSPEIQERQRRTSREYYHKKKAALQVERSQVGLVF
jgi:hypothetical protein